MESKLSRFHVGKALFPYEKRPALIGELIIIATELLLIALSWQKRLYGIVFVILLDLVFLSPLKAGRALFYDTLVFDRKSTNFRLFFRYYRYGYRKTVCWRFLLWTRIAAWGIFFSVLPCALGLFRNQIPEENALLATAVNLLFYFVFTICLTLLILIMISYSPTSFLLLYADSANKAFKLKRLIFHRKLSSLLQAHWNLLKRLPFLLFILPTPYLLMDFRTEQAREIRKQIDGFLQKKSS